jgi:signal transduction histidine kinase
VSRTSERSDGLAVARESDLTPLPGGVEPHARISTLVEAANVPVSWLDGLITLTQDLPFEDGPEPLVRAFTSSVERLVPELRVGIRLRDAEGHAMRDSVEVSSGLRHTTDPPKSNERVRVVRLFPDSAHERSTPLPGVSAAALHFASEQDVLGSDASPHVQMMDRVAMAAAHALARCEAEGKSAALARELRAAEAQMVQAEKLAAFGQIAAGMVHELNNPLTSIAAYTDFLLRRAASRPGTDEDDVERLRRIAESANRMLRFTRDLVSYARPSEDVPIAVELNLIIERALAFCDHELSGVGVSVERAFHAEIRPVRGLPEQLAQVFVNLVINACHAMAPGGSAAATARPPVLRLTTLPGPGVVIVHIEDTGCGIEKDNLERIFTPFFTTKAAGRGTGLGLSIVKRIVDGHRGEIRAESDPAYGTRFILTFPSE